MALVPLTRGVTQPLTGENAPIILSPSSPGLPQPTPPDPETAMGVAGILAVGEGLIDSAAAALAAAAAGVTAEGAGVALTAAGVVLALLDPARVVGMGPQSGLQVTPAVFQSIEQEGRWKAVPPFNSARQLDVPSAPGNVPYMLGGQPGAAFGGLKRLTKPLFTVTCESGSKFVVDVTWWFDGLEIYAGYAGLASATGFGSVYSNMASVALQAIPFGNYFPAAALITWSGWVNPIGPGYEEFRGAFLVSADGQFSEILRYRDTSTTYMQHWTRDGDPERLFWSSEDGFLLTP